MNQAHPIHALTIGLLMLFTADAFVRKERSLAAALARNLGTS